MESEIRQLHIFFFPFPAHGHMIPTADMAKLFGTHGVKTTLITTPANAPLFSKSVQRANELGIQIDIKIIKYPSVEGISMLQESLELRLREYKPECLVAYMLFPWATDSAHKFGIPRFVFHGTSFFAVCAGTCVALYQPHKKVSSDSEPFVIPNLPGDIKLTRNQLADFVKQDVGETSFIKLFEAAAESG
ncbi:Glycosyltransferase [Melia azedarach]|uniref:Glycosyltransferase n=1 Tax=Melia azedarach TaxID=155640 RepID=A0ACC1Y014_MELAZ|nr:Glycosyltransferase [Melia azedarach]